MAYSETTPQVPVMRYADLANPRRLDELVVPTEPSLGSVITAFDAAIANQQPQISNAYYPGVYDVPLTRIEVQEKLLNSKRLSLPKRLRHIFDEAKRRPLRDGEMNEVYTFFYKRKAS